MATETLSHKPSGEVDFVAPSELQCGQIVLGPDGRVATVLPLRGAEAGDLIAAAVSGRRHFAKAASVVLLAGQEAYFVPASNVVSFYAPGRVFAGVVLADAAAADTDVLLDQNARGGLVVDSRAGYWDQTVVGAATSSVLAGGAIKLGLIATSEAEKAVAISEAAFDVDDGPVLEFRAAVFDASGSAVDIDIGFASADHASDLEAVTALVTVHMDGGDNKINVQSDDGVTDVAPVDTTVAWVDDTFFHGLIDARDKTSVKVYINGVRVAAATVFTLAGYSANLRAIAHTEKTTGTTTADVRVDRLRVWLASRA